MYFLHDSSTFYRVPIDTSVDSKGFADWPVGCTSKRHETRLAFTACYNTWIHAIGGNRVVSTEGLMIILIAIALVVLFFAFAVNSANNLD
jgi:hypothetical protein